jgi:uncharacterized protein YacL (UPF0231 family)
MSLRNILIGLGIALALLIAIVLVVGHWSPGEQPQQAAKTMSIEVGDHTVTVGGQYKNLTQESMADGMSINVDGHEITVNADQLTVDGKSQVLEAGQDVDVNVDDKGAVNVKLVQSDAGSAGRTSP